MKKVVVLSLASLFLLTGCGNKVKCSNDGTTYEGTIKDGYVTKVTISEKMKSKSEAKSACDSIKTLYGKDKVKCSGKKVSMTMDVPKASKVTKDDFKKEFCK